jgi:hypothetical protein
MEEKFNSVFRLLLAIPFTIPANFSLKRKGVNRRKDKIIRIPESIIAQILNLLFIPLCLIIYPIIRKEFSR